MRNNCCFMICVGFWILTLSLSSTYGRKLVRDGQNDSFVCNKTYNGSNNATELRPPIISDHLVGKPFYCFYKFQGVPGQRVMIEIQELNLGQYDPDQKKCVNGFLRLWDGLKASGYHPYLPNTICGSQHRDLDIKKFSTVSNAMIEYNIEYVRKDMMFKLKYNFVNMDSEYNPYEEQLTHDMQPTKHSASVCDWTIDIDKCENECQILSPGYPGMYPPDTECIYRVSSQDPNTMIQINFHGMSFNGPSESNERSFNLRPSSQCKDDYVSIQDNSIQGTPVFAKFCGQKTQDIITTGNNIKIKFVTSQEIPPFGYNGFHLSVTGITKEWNSFGYHLNTTLCNWRFTTASGSMSTPDHWLPPRSSCTYSFNVKPMHVLKLRFNVYGLSPGCDDNIYIYEGGDVKDRMCDSNIPTGNEDSRQERLTFKLWGPVVTVVYNTRAGQYQGQTQHGFWLSFQQTLDTLDQFISQPHPNPALQEDSYLKDNGSSSADKLTHKITLQTIAFVHVVFYTMLKMIAERSML